jgi:hypothetical protein
MSEWSRGAAWWPSPPSLCTAAAAAWYVRAMYEQKRRSLIWEQFSLLNIKG